MRTFPKHGCLLNTHSNLRHRGPFINLVIAFSKVNVCVCRPQSFLKYQTTTYIFILLTLYGRIKVLILTCLRKKKNKPKKSHTP